jgi:hypothetical protein
MTSKGASDTQTQSNAIAGGNSNFVAASGNLGSSSLSAYSGPWYVETQTLNINYVRIPFEGSWTNTCAASLSGLSTTHGNINSTQLMITFDASYEAKVVYQNFNSSSVQQSQEFTIIAASGDPNGVSYGTVSGTILGPMGSIITSKPFIRRTPYLATSGQPLVNKVATGSNFGIFSVSAVEDATTFFTDLNFWSQYGDPVGNASTRPEKAARIGTSFSYIPGAYDTSKEFQPLSVLLMYIANRITGEGMVSYPVGNVNPIFANGPNPFFPAFDTGIAEYDSNRHA